MRMSLCRALVLLRHKDLLALTDLLQLFFDLLKCQDKTLRKFLRDHIVTDLKNVNAKHKVLILEEGGRPKTNSRPFFNRTNGCNQPKAQKASVKHYFLDHRQNFTFQSERAIITYRLKVKLKIMRNKKYIRTLRSSIK